MNRNNIRLLTTQRRVSEENAKKRRELIGGRTPEDAVQLVLTPPSGYASSFLVMLVTIATGLITALIILFIK